MNANAYAWEGRLDPTHDNAWLIAEAVRDSSVLDGPVSELALLSDGDGWHLPTVDPEGDGTWVKLCGENVVDALAGRRVRVTVEVLDDVG